MFGLSVQTVYLYGLIICGSLTFLYILFSDLLDGLSEAIPFLTPLFFFSFLTFFSASGYLFAYTSLQNYWIISISALIALLLVILLNVFVLIPLSSAEESLAFTEDSLKGRLGTIITSVPADGYGEVFIEGVSGTISKPAASFKNTAIPLGSKVLVVDIQRGNALVVIYEEVMTNHSL
ncbi:hypothetical protein F6Y03_22845 [Bacillus megaterium]|nr:hypothetical protein [Priestia megaterium]